MVTVSPKPKQVTNSLKSNNKSSKNDKNTNAKKVRKNVRFGYYRPVLEVDEKYLKTLLSTLKSEFVDAEKGKKKEIEKRIKEIEKVLDSSEEYTTPYNWEPVLNALKSGEISSNKNILGKLAEVDTTTFMPKDENKDNDIIYFQIVNNRDINPPSKKQPGKKRTDIDLGDNEYIGEFMGLLYDKNISVFMVQNNRYSLSISQIEHFFTLLRIEYLKLINKINEDSMFYMVSFRPIVNKDILKNMNKNSTYTKFSIKGSDISLLSLAENQSGAIYHIGKILSEFKGVNFNIDVSVNARKKDVASLSQDEIVSIFNNFQTIKSDLKPDINVHFKSKKDGKTDAVNWLVPKMESIIDFQYTPKKALGYHYVYQRMLETYRLNEDTINLIIYGAKS